MTAPAPTGLTKLAISQHLVTTLSHNEIFQVLENLAAPGMLEEFGVEYVNVVRTMLLRRLDSFRRGRRGLVSVPRLDPS